MDHQASWTELHLMNVLLGSVLLHRYLQLIMSLWSSCQITTASQLAHQCC